MPRQAASFEVMIYAAELAQKQRRVTPVRCRCLRAVDGGSITDEMFAWVFIL